MSTPDRLVLPTHLGFPEWREGEFACFEPSLRAARVALDDLAKFLRLRVAFDDEEFRSAFKRASTVVMHSVTALPPGRGFPSVTDEEALCVALGIERSLPAERVRPFVAYDRFFCCVRSATLSAGDLAASTLRVMSQALETIPQLRLGPDDDLALVESFVAGMDVFQAADPDAGCLADGAAYRVATIDDHAETNPNLAMRLWIDGHHVFALLTLLASAASRRALSLLASADTNASVAWLTRSRQLLRGTTSAMWMASAFSRSRYLADVRPAMEQAWPNGFTGDMNLEFARLKVDIRSLFEAAEKETSWLNSEAVRRAMKALCNDWRLDMVSHALLAAYRVVDDVSLAGKADEGSGAGPGMSAVELLLDMAADRQEQVAPVVLLAKGGSLARQDRKSA
jgi:hypothetical protein